MSPLNWIAAIVWWVATNMPIYWPRDSDYEWYEKRTKEGHGRPHYWVFGPVWLFIYSLISVAIFLYWRDHSYSHHYTATLAVYLVNIGLCKFWNALFFGFRDPLLALIAVVAILGTSITVLVFFCMSHATASIALYAPYVAWSAIATYMSWAFYMAQERPFAYQNARNVMDAAIGFAI